MHCMRVAFIGKGGSGKTTTSSLFSLLAARAGHRVLALDADINQHLSGALGIEAMPRSMGTHLDEIKRHLAGTNERFDASSMHKTAPPGGGSRFVTLAQDDWFVERFTAMANGVRVAGAGEVPDENIGVKCYHGLNGAVELVLGHMIDRPEDIVVVDMTAGADVLSSSLFTKVDALVIVVEPTLKSLSVYGQVKPYADQYGIPLLVVANKIEAEEDLKFIKEHVGDIDTAIGALDYVKRRERGTDEGISLLDKEAAASLRQLRNTLLKLERDWDILQKRAEAMHLKNAKSWMGEAALGHIDPGFSLKQAADYYLG